MREQPCQLVYREIDREGIDAIRTLWEQLIAHHVQISLRFGQTPASRNFEARKRELLTKAGVGNLRVEVASTGQNGKPAAYCVSSVSTDGIGEIDSIFVEENLRGQGVGTELMKRAIAWLDSMKVSSKTVSVMFQNDKALSFYRRFNFYPRTVLLQEEHRTLVVV